VEVGEPEKFRLDEFIRKGLAARKDPREVIADPKARYYGIAVSDNTLVPDPGARLGKSVSKTGSVSRPRPGAPPDSERGKAYDEFKTNVGAGATLRRHPDGARG